MSLGLTKEKLRTLGVETLAVVATPAERARRYFKLRPPRCTVAADADLVTHRAFGAPRAPLTEEIMHAVSALGDKLAREIGLSVGPSGSRETLDREDGIDTTEHDADLQRNQGLLATQFLIDRDGVIRWASCEDPSKGLEGLGGFPSDEELLAAARAL